MVFCIDVLRNSWIIFMIKTIILADSYYILKNIKIIRIPKFLIYERK